MIEDLRIQLLQQEKQDERQQTNYDYDITINTHPDSAPYYQPSFSKNNAITYCHYPAAKYHIESENIGYLEKDVEIEIMSNTSYINNKNDSNLKNYIKSDNKHKLIEITIKEYFRILKYGYWNLMRNSTIVTNSEFTRKIIVDAFGIDYDSIYVLSPPIDIDIFRNVELMSAQDNGDENHKRNDTVIVISRIATHKELENAIKLAKILKYKNIGRGMIIVGNLYNYFEYYIYLKQLVVDLRLADFVTFEINASLVSYLI